MTVVDSSGFHNPFHNRGSVVDKDYVVHHYHHRPNT